MTDQRYYAASEASLGHTAIYKLHKYFARRPYNQFRSLIRHYVPAEGIVLDCFAGGGVTLVEGITLGRRVISADINPVACMVQRFQVLEVPAPRIIQLTDEIALDVPDEHVDWYRTECQHCPELADVRWFEHAYLVECPECRSETPLTNDARPRHASGRIRTGSYDCISCSHTLTAIDARRTGSVILNVRLRCSNCGAHETRAASKVDQTVLALIGETESAICRRYGLFVPRQHIPVDWDRQFEDGLARKGFVTFADLFTPRNRITMAHFFAGLKQRRDLLTDDEYLGVLGLFSALLRYVNNMTFSTRNWMDGRPVAWAKHAFWTPNQFVEVNPFEYLKHRQLALRKAQTDRRSRFLGRTHSPVPGEVVDQKADYSIICADARRLDLPDGCVDAVITDPPFGGNVQYGELTHFWSVWLKGLNPFETRLFALEDEILVHRKRRSQSKTYDIYRSGLTAVFRECFRVLKSKAVLVFTFNNTNGEAWYSVMKAAFDAGFRLNPKGVHYQDEIKAYRDTAHLRFNGELQGDVLYTFEKGNTSITNRPPDPNTWVTTYAETLPKSCSPEEERSLAIALHLEIVRFAAATIQGGAPKSECLRWLDLLALISARDGGEQGNESLRDRCFARRNLAALAR